uniref:Family with sequence similarity 151 member B n=1 Tax=Corvus moneduloides TaxID=1196302 RepID=A0A8U7NRJ3_CORMO
MKLFSRAGATPKTRLRLCCDVHMVEADVLLRGGRGDPILAHPPDTDSDITLQEWLAEMVSTNKGIKLDFKSLGAVGPSLELLSRLRRALERPVWLNGDVLPGPRGGRPPLDARAFLAAVASSCPAATLSLGWTTGCHRGQGYAWPMVQEMSRLCQPLSQPVTFAVRAALVPSSVPQLQWLMQQSHRSVPALTCPDQLVSACIKHSTFMCPCSSRWPWKCFCLRFFISLRSHSDSSDRRSLLISLK